MYYSVFVLSLVVALKKIMIMDVFLFFYHFLYLRLIKMSSPNLNNVIILGCILSYVSVILFAFDGNHLTVNLCKVS